MVRLMASRWGGRLGVACVLCAGLGAMLISIAAGLVYLDARGHRRAELRLMASGLSPEEARQHLDDDLPDVRPILAALLTGSCGAALACGAAAATVWRLVYPCTDGPARPRGGPQDAWSDEQPWTSSRGL